MKRWNNAVGDYIESPSIDAFIKDIIEVCRRHRLSISHEDGHGAFEIEAIDDYNILWLEAAHDNTGGAK